MVFNVSEADNCCSLLAFQNWTLRCVAYNLPNSYQMVMNAPLSGIIYQKKFK